MLGRYAEDVSSAALCIVSGFATVRTAAVVRSAALSDALGVHQLLLHVLDAHTGDRLVGDHVQPVEASRRSEVHEQLLGGLLPHARDVLVGHGRHVGQGVDLLDCHFGHNVLLSLVPSRLDSYLDTLT